MKLSEIISNLQQQDIVNILTELGAPEYKGDITSNVLTFRTICHNEPGQGKFKLVYYHETKTFFCFSECSKSYGIIDLIMKVKDIDRRKAISEFYRIMNISLAFNIEEGFEIEKVDISFVTRFKKKERPKYEILNEIDKSILNQFYPYYPGTWIDNDFISVDALKKFEIKFDVYENRAIIRHLDISGRCIGIKVRNFQKHLQDNYKYMPLIEGKKMYNYPTSMNLYGIFENKNAIKKFKKVILFESEKAVMQHYSYYGEDSVAVAISGSAFSEYQIELLNQLEVETVIIAVDKEFMELNDEKDWKYRLKIKKMFVDKLKPFFNVEIVWDFEGLLKEKMAPTDLGREIWEKLFIKRIAV